MIDGVDVKVLSALSKEPLASINRLKDSVGLSATGLQKRIRSLVERGILSKEFVRAQISYHALGLEPYVVFANSRPSEWDKVERACDAHPYTQFRVRCMGAVNGFMMIFAQPSNTKTQLLEFLNGLKNIGAITDYIVHSPIAQTGHSETSFEMYHPDGIWTIDWNALLSTIEKSNHELGRTPVSLVHSLDETDVKILRRLSINAREERKTMAEDIGIPDYELSRRVKRLSDNNAVEFCRVVHETGVLGVLMTVVLRCKAPLDTTGRIVNSAGELPFQGSIFPVDDGFIVLANVPQTEVTNLVTLMQKVSSSVELMWADYASSMKYYFDNEPSNFGEYGWKVDRRYVVEEPMAKVSSPLKDA